MGGGGGFVGLLPGGGGGSGRVGPAESPPPSPGVPGGCQRLHRKRGLRQNPCHPERGVSPHWWGPIGGLILDTWR